VPEKDTLSVFLFIRLRPGSPLRCVRDDIYIEMNKFWESKSAKDFTREEWEAICDGCARCCLHVLEDEDDHSRYQTNVCCRYLDLQTCRCTRYAERSQLVPTCVTLTPENFNQLDFLPSTCAYRYLAEGKPLPSWHPLVSGDAQSVHSAGVSIMHWATPEDDVVDFEDHIINALPEDIPVDLSDDFSNDFQDP